MSQDAIAAAIRTLVATGAGATAKVHDGVRWAAQESDFRDLHRDATAGRIHAWYVTRRGKTEDVTGTTNLSILTHDFRVIGFYAVDDSAAGTSAVSENELRPIVDAIETQLRQSFTLSGEAMNSGPPVTIEEGHRVLHGVLCHYTEIQLLVQERTSYVGA